MHYNFQINLCLFHSLIIDAKYGLGYLTVASSCLYNESTVNKWGEHETRYVFKSIIKNTCFSNMLK